MLSLLLNVFSGMELDYDYVNFIIINVIYLTDLLINSDNYNNTSNLSIYSCTYILIYNIIVQPYKYQIIKMAFIRVVKNNNKQNE